MKHTSDSTPQRGEPIPEHFFRLISDFTYDWESWLSCDGEVLWVNQAVARFTGYTPEECLTMDDYPIPLVAPEDRSRIARCVDEGSGGSTANNVEFRALHRDGSQCWCAVSWQPMIDASGQSLGFRASVRDISEKKQMREQLYLHNEHLEQLVQERTVRIANLEQHRLKMEKLAALGELAAGVAHEINNPLAGIRNAFALFKRNLPKQAKHYDKLELIDNEIERISGITHQMYQLYRPSQQRASTFSLKQAIDEAITLALPMSRKAKVKVVASFGSNDAGRLANPSQDVTQQTAGAASDNPTVVLREGELKQVLLNLIHNAIQASEAGDQVEVAARTDEKHAFITVTDHGHGIATHVIGKIFDPFFSTKTETVGQGMGLGLSVTRGIIEAMEGTIEVASEPNVGTEFVVRLPRRLEGDCR
ncbi:ATP-binding protein [Stieleria sp. TO1_6]|uniref:PAS domain-containing sensor histidine kinase n=1 Tax=Stieleria tagensis TaxID=2956795 RepID=UPI00209B6156|nr:ATP-binding protein [Stieleria tagensis]MCO8120898.1 ATP-binding protein [Stieleria tagensis]